MTAMLSKELHPVITCFVLKFLYLPYIPQKINFLLKYKQHINADECLKISNVVPVLLSTMP